MLEAFGTSETVVWTPAATGEAVQVLVSWQDHFVTYEQDGGIAVENISLACSGKVVDFLEVAEQDIIERKGVRHRVVDIRPEGVELVTLILQRLAR